MRPKRYKNDSIPGKLAFIRQLACLTSGCCYLFTAAIVMANETGEPASVISGELKASVQLDHIGTNSEANHSQSIAEPTIEADLIWRLPGNFRIHANATLDSVKDTLLRKDNWFEGLGLLSDDLFLLYDVDGHDLIACKRDITSGLARNEARGLYGTDLVDEFAIESVLTLGTELTTGEENSGKLAVAAVVFMTDKTFLGNSLITQQAEQESLTASTA